MVVNTPIRSILFTLLWVLGSVIVFGQPPNNFCATAISIPDPVNYCSPADAFTLVGATFNAPVVPSCQASNNNDVWFRFEARATELSVRVNGDAGIIRTGTILFPEVTVYDGTCTNLNQLGCLSNAFGAGVVEVLVRNLTINRTYYVRVSSRNNESSTFQLCINNFIAVPDPSSDCISGVVLCDKSPFVVPALIGVGNNPNEVNGTCIGEEFASAWYKWTCDEPGNLFFTLTPNNPSDDLDFALYELPGGINDCNNKRLIRCMASGENLGQPLANWIRCYGPTGLRPGSTDTEERPGCQPGDDNFLAPIEMVRGRAYALIVNNFSNTGSGFSIEFGGTGTFVGPTADFIIAEPDRFCRRDSVLFVDLSAAEFGGALQDFAWSFGAGSFPNVRSGSGSHNIFYETPGPKTITLSVRNERGCIVSRTRQILVECCDYPVVVNAGGTQIVDLGDPIQLSAFVDLPGDTYNFTWSPENLLDCSTCPDPIALIPRDTWIQLFVIDEEGCAGIDSVLLRVNNIKPVYAPNAFTPNGDNINDRFTIYTNPAGVSIRLLRIYNRWGDLVYEGIDLPPGNNDFGWDGTFRGRQVEPGVFVYYAEVEFLDGEIGRLTGEVTLFK